MYFTSFLNVCFLFFFCPGRCTPHASQSCQITVRFAALGNSIAAIGYLIIASVTAASHDDNAADALYLVFSQYGRHHHGAGDLCRSGHCWPRIPGPGLRRLLGPAAFCDASCTSGRASSAPNGLHRRQNRGSCIAKTAARRHPTVSC